MTFLANETPARTCTREATNVLCPECFNASDHDGHEIVFVESKLFTLACCCGNTTGFHHPEKAGCANHPPDPQAHNKPPPSYEKPLPEATEFQRLCVAAEQKQLPPHLQHIYEVFLILVDYMLAVMTVALPPKEYKLPAKPIDYGTFYGAYTNLSPTQWNQGPWTVTVMSDERHSYAEVIKQCVHALGISADSAAVWTKELEDVVSAVVCLF